MRGATWEFQLDPGQTPGADGVGVAVALLASLASLVGAWFGGLQGVLAILATRTESIVFAHPVRLRIVARLSLLPGDHFRSLVRAVGAGMGAVEYHLHILVQNGYVRGVRSNGKVRYYLVGDGTDIERNRLFSEYWNYRDLRLRVLFILRREGESTPLSVARKLGISRQLASYHLGHLVQLGLARKDRGHYYA